MFCWRITKHNSQYQDERGAYIQDTWTFISDLGKRYYFLKSIFVMFYYPR